MNLTWKQNETTGNYEANFSAKLMSVSDKTFASNNEKGTLYRAVTIQLENGNSFQGIMYESNYKHGVTIGNSYLCRAINSGKDENVLLTVSHLAAAPRATTKDFGFSLADVKEEIKSDAGFSSVK